MAQQLVAGKVALGVVNRLQATDVDVRQPERPSVAPGAGELAFGSLEEAAPVQHSC